MTTFAVTYDYLCPFARIANETVVEALRDGADWELTFSAFSLAQSHVDEGQPDVWDRAVGADGTRGVMALQLSLAVREHFPESSAIYLGLAQMYEEKDDIELAIQHAEKSLELNPRNPVAQRLLRQLRGND